MLESELDTCVLARMPLGVLRMPRTSVKKSKEYILRSDFRNLLALSTSQRLPDICTHQLPTCRNPYVMATSMLIIALDKGVKGTQCNAKHLQGALSSSLMF